MVERKFAEGNQRHGIKKARYWALIMVSIQSFMVALVMNLERLVKLTLISATELRLGVAV